MDTAPRALPATPGAPRPPWTLLRFAGAGAAGNLAHAGVFVVVAATAVPVALVNVVAVVVSTLVTNELHRRFSFRAADTPWWHGHGVGGAAALVGLVLSTSALTLWHHLVPGAGTAGGLVVVHVVAGLVGLVDFVVLRRALSPAALSPAALSPAAQSPVGTGGGPTG